MNDSFLSAAGKLQHARPTDILQDFLTRRVKSFTRHVKVFTRHVKKFTRHVKIFIPARSRTLSRPHISGFLPP
ncbi:MAG TPA: hypothetical protein PLN34_08845, partial [Alloprevotella sp.]|nr:hypothetical protein [Alloprevotella sp.]